MTLSPEQTRAFGRAAESAVRGLRAELYADLPRFLAGEVPPTARPFLVRAHETAFGAASATPADRDDGDEVFFARFTACVRLLVVSQTALARAERVGRAVAGALDRHTAACEAMCFGTPEEASAALQAMNALGRALMRARAVQTRVEPALRERCYPGTERDVGLVMARFVDPAAERVESLMERIEDRDDRRWAGLYRPVARL